MNIAQMMRQVQEMQGKMAVLQEQLNHIEVTGQAGNGAVVATMSGKADLKKIKISREIVDPNDVEMLEDMIVAACNDAKSKVETMVAGETEKLMGDVKLPPGVKLPL